MPRPRIPASVKKARGTFKAARDAKRPPEPPASTIPAPPKSCSPTERRAWHELAAQVEASHVYSVSDYTSFRVLVRSVALLDDMPPDAAPTAAARMVQSVSTMLARFGLDPASRGKVERLVEKAPDELAEFGPELRAIPGGKGK
jgi:hypothetical protein